MCQLYFYTIVFFSYLYGFSFSKAKTNLYFYWIMTPIVITFFLMVFYWINMPILTWASYPSVRWPSYPQSTIFYSRPSYIRWAKDMDNNMQSYTKEDILYYQQAIRFFRNWIYLLIAIPWNFLLVRKRTKNKDTHRNYVYASIQSILHN